MDGIGECENGRVCAGSFQFWNGTSVGKLETNMSVFGEGMDLCGVEDRSNSLEGGVASSGDVASSGGMASSGDVVLSGGTKELSESVTASPPGSSLNAKPPPIYP